jgi:uncharacterized protein (TIGR04255 family)
MSRPLDRLASVETTTSTRNQQRGRGGRRSRLPDLYAWFGAGSVRFGSMAKYANAPLKLVVFAAELRPVALLGETATLDEVHARIRDELPIREDVTNALVPGPDGGLVPANGARFVDRGQHRAVIVTPSRIAADTTQYSTFSEFARFLGRVLDAVAALAPGRACRRLGLRYVDEIRVPGAEPGNLEQWREWVDDSLFAKVALRERPRNSSREIAGVVDDTDDNGFGVRFAWHTGNGHAVQPVGPLIVPDPSPPGPYLALDTDSYWVAQPGTEVVGLGDPTLLDRVRKLHEPVQDYFEMSLTGRLRQEVLGPVIE